MAAPLLPSESVDIIQESTEDDPTIRNISSRSKRDFVHFMRDFGVFQKIIGFIIAVSLLDFIKSLVTYLVIKYLGIRNELLNSTVCLLVIILLIYIFINFIFYRHLYTKDVAKEEVIKKALAEKKVEVVKKKFDEHKGIKKAIHKGTNLSAMNNELYQESFTPKNAFSGLYGGYSL